MRAMTASPSALIPLSVLALLLFLALPPASAQLPPALEADRLLVRAEREIQEGDYSAAAAALEQIVELQAEHDLATLAAFWFRRAQVAQEAGHYERAIESATRYLEEAGQEGEHHGAALALRDAAEDAKQLAAQNLSRFVSQWESRMVVIPAGSFRMGCLSNDDDCEEGEFPVHEVAIRSFALSKHEVTFDDWGACVRHGGCNGYRPDDEGWGYGSRPVINVSGEDAQSFVAWLSRVTGDTYRLPTEAEWEYAARAGTETKYSWGRRIGRNQANCDGCRSRWDNEMTAPVGSFSPNGFGLHDMHGNVWERVEDCWNDSYVARPPTAAPGAEETAPGALCAAVPGTTRRGACAPLCAPAFPPSTATSISPVSALPGPSPPEFRLYASSRARTGRRPQDLTHLMGRAGAARHLRARRDLKAEGRLSARVWVAALI